MLIDLINIPDPDSVAPSAILQDGYRAQFFNF
jgi:hypothetical protein